MKDGVLMADPVEKPYKDQAAFRQALEERLRTRAREKGVDVQRMYRQVAFDRFLARIFETQKTAWILKGGYALELRLKNIARTTKDMDFSVVRMAEPAPEKVRDVLAEDAAKDLGDGFSFLISAALDEVDQATYGGWSYNVRAQLAGREFASFRIDVAVGDAVIDPPQWETGPDLLGFAGITPAHVAVYPKGPALRRKNSCIYIPTDLFQGQRSRRSHFVD